MRNQEEKENHLKRIAVHLAHQMDEEKRLYTENLPPWKEAEIRDYGRYLREEISKQGYASQIGLIMNYADEYKKMSIVQYMKWIRE